MNGQIKQLWQMISRTHKNVIKQIEQITHQIVFTATKFVSGPCAKRLDYAFPNDPLP